ncbi:hypothetical protein IFM89_028538 [Coptis chinensis]|uniref:Uncharacterized protein n=1 Tax=Coptis chinensis TaxID=261450 RepID=A0A835M4G6_9MAGN|nr:hypothetical protein IFM89_028538 [Coptis chinensis]
MNAAEKEKAGPPIPTFQRSSLIAATSSQNNRLICKPVTCLLQYMILKTFCAVLGILAFVLGLCGVYGDGDFKWHYGRAVIPGKPKVGTVHVQGILPDPKSCPICSTCSFVFHMSPVVCPPVSVFHFLVLDSHFKPESASNVSCRFPVLNSSQMETYVEAPGTSVTSVQDIVIGGGGHVNSLPLSVSPSPQL